MTGAEHCAASLTEGDMQVIADALAELRRSRRGQLTLSVESNVCATQIKVRQIRKAMAR